MNCFGYAPFFFFSLRHQRRYLAWPASLVQGDEHKIGGRNVAYLAGEDVFGFDPHANFQGGATGVIDRRLEGDQIADKDRFEKAHAIDAGSDHATADVAHRGNAGRGIDQFHDRAAVDVAKWVRVARQHLLTHDDP